MLDVLKQRSRRDVGVFIPGSSWVGQQHSWCGHLLR
jgi:hypothetical protein